MCVMRINRLMVKCVDEANNHEMRLVMNEPLKLHTSRYSLNSLGLIHAFLLSKTLRSLKILSVCTGQVVMNGLILWRSRPMDVVATSRSVSFTFDSATVKSMHLNDPAQRNIGNKRLG